jgi:hypothetical protein
MTKKEELIQFIQETPEGKMVVLKQYSKGSVETVFHELAMTNEDAIRFIEENFSDSVRLERDGQTIVVKGWVYEDKPLKEVE